MDDEKILPAPITLPHNRETEEALLGSIEINPEIFPDILEFLTADDFYIYRHKYIFQAMERLHQKKIEIDLLTLGEELEQSGQLEEIGGPAYLTHLATASEFSYHAEDYARIVERYARKREWLLFANQVANLSFDVNIEPEEIRANALQMIEKQKIPIGNQIIPADVAALALMQIIDSGKPLGLSTGLPLLDKQLGAMPFGETILIVGDATLGKTALCLQIAETVAMNQYDDLGNVTRQGQKVLYISTESKAHTMIARRVCGLVEIEQKKLRSGEITEEQRERLSEEIQNYQGRFGGSLYFDDQSNTIDAIERSITQLKPNLVVVDHLGELKISGDNRTIGLLDAFDRLKAIGKKHNAVMLVIHTISADDANSKGEDDLPSFNSLGWAKDLKYKTDILLGLYASKQTLSEPNLEKRFLWIMKDREGSRWAKVNLRFNTLQQWYVDSML